MHHRTATSAARSDALHGLYCLSMGDICLSESSSVSAFSLRRAQGTVEVMDKNDHRAALLENGEEGGCRTEAAAAAHVHLNVSLQTSSSSVTRDQVGRRR